MRILPGPTRSCVTCGRRDIQINLQRFARDGDGRVVLDNNKKLAGRGAYCCESEECVAKFVHNNKKISHVFRLSAEREKNK